MKTVLNIIIRVAIAVVLLYLVIRQIDLDKVLRLVADCNIFFLFAGILTVLTHISLNSYRWYIIVRTLADKIPYNVTFKITYLGTLMNNFMPGSVGGDLARVYWVIKEQAKRIALAGSVIADRILGLATIATLGFIASWWIMFNPEFNWLSIYTCIIFFLFCFVVFVYFNKKIRESFLGNIVKKFIPFKRQFYELDDAFKKLRFSGKQLKFAFSVSLVSQLLLICTLYMSAKALNIKELEFSYLLCVAPIIFLITAVPISIGAVGVQEGIFFYFFGFVGVTQNYAFAMSIIYRIIVIAATIPSVFVLFAPLRKK
ncbi:MAG: flippase-like domain-containing protein [Planctomycetes bacterium]|nr:flippase-like domain-containing protein [Planctomycetota bacterium]